MPRIPRISGRSRKDPVPETGADLAQTAVDAPPPAADPSAPVADTSQTAADAPPPAEAQAPPDAPAPPEAATESTAGAAPVTTEFPVLGADPQVPSEQTAVMEAAPQALTGAPPAPEGGDASATGQPTAAEPATGEPAAPEQGSFLDRGRMRRRLRYLRRTRELAFRDLGGLQFDLYRFGRSRDDLVGGKLARLTAIDTELRALESALADRQEVTVLREPGLAACPRCGALHGSDANYCPMCALPVRPGAGLPVGSPSAPAPEAPVVQGS